MTKTKLNKIIRFIKSGKTISFNDSYNTDNYGFNMSEHDKVFRVINQLYGMKCFWPDSFSTEQILKEL